MHIACTRFNNLTYDENMSYRQKNKEIVIYGSALKIRCIYDIGCKIYVAEMNNETDKIEGIGLINNNLVCDRRHKIYDNNEHNRYIYRGKHWISRSQIEAYEPEINEIFDIILFKGKSNLKRRIGITMITEKLFTNWNFEMTILKQMVKRCFRYYYDNIESSSIVSLNKEINAHCEQQEETDQNKLLETEEYIEIIPVKRLRKK